MSTIRPPKRFVPIPTIYVLEVGQRPILAFEATSAREAQELANEDWLQDDLKRLRSNGEQLCKAKLRIGVAAGEHLNELRGAKQNRPRAMSRP